LRVWSAGCATGEEAYSLGIVLLEQPEATTTAIRNFLSGAIFPGK
jgi:chemotaxis methyl-accepting protein methylase